MSNHEMLQLQKNELLAGSESQSVVIRFVATASEFTKKNLLSVGLAATALLLGSAYLLRQEAASCIDGFGSGAKWIVRAGSAMENGVVSSLPLELNSTSTTVQAASEAQLLHSGASTSGTWSEAAMLTVAPKRMIGAITSGEGFQLQATRQAGILGSVVHGVP